MMTRYIAEGRNCFYCEAITPIRVNRSSEYFDRLKELLSHGYTVRCIGRCKATLVRSDGNIFDKVLLYTKGWRE